MTPQDRLDHIRKVCTDEATAKTYHPGWGIKEWLEHVAMLTDAHTIPTKELEGKSE